MRKLHNTLQELKVPLLPRRPMGILEPRRLPAESVDPRRPRSFRLGRLSSAIPLSGSSEKKLITDGWACLAR